MTLSDDFSKKTKTPFDTKLALTMVESLAKGADFRTSEDPAVKLMYAEYLKYKLRDAIDTDDPAQVKAVVDEGANVNCYMPGANSDCSALYYAFLRDKLKSAAALLENNADPDLQQVAGESKLALCAAHVFDVMRFARTGDTSLTATRMLMACNVDADRKTDHFYAMYGGHVSVREVVAKPLEDDRFASLKEALCALYDAYPIKIQDNKIASRRPSI